MIQRQPGPFKRFVSRFFRLTFQLVFLVLLYAVGSFLLVRSTAESREIVIESTSDASPAPVHAPDSLRLCTYNIAHGRGGGFKAKNTDGGDKEEKRQRLQAIGEKFKQQQLDIVVLNEVDFNCPWSFGLDQADIIAEAAGFPYVVKQRNVDSGVPLVYPFSFGNAILSRFPIESAEMIKFPPHSELERLAGGNHDAVLAKVQLGRDETIAILGAHLEVRSEDVRVQCASKIVQLQRDLKIPFILMGDLNSTPPGFPDSRRSKSAQNAMEILDSFGSFIRLPEEKKATHQDFTYPTSGPRRIIDWILPDENWTFMQYGVLQTVPHSDHLPVIAAIRRR